MRSLLRVRLPPPPPFLRLKSSKGTTKYRFELSFCQNTSILAISG
nr:MAG TPA: hypothetical protein [Caudoviricetes sp.]